MSTRAYSLRDVSALAVFPMLGALDTHARRVFVHPDVVRTEDAL
jgi:hypothetical protein